jgi:hypothetical protein
MYVSMEGPSTERSESFCCKPSPNIVNDWMSALFLRKEYLPAHVNIVSALWRGHTGYTAYSSLTGDG